MLVQAITLHPPPSIPPPCYICEGPSTERKTSPNNLKGNAGRLYYKCDSCDEFLVFKDDRGNHPNNPECFCRLSSKMQAAGPMKRRGVHFVCRVGRCNFYSRLVDSYGTQLFVQDNQVLNKLTERRIL